jgi:hypothetical protein
MKVGERAAWVGDESIRGRGSSGKVVSISGTRIVVNWGGGDEREESLGDLLTTREAAEVGIAPWSGPSQAAVAAVADLLDQWGLTHPQTGPPAATVAHDVLQEAHHPALGLDRSVRLGEIVEALDDENYHDAAQWLREWWGESRAATERALLIAADEANQRIANCHAEVACPRCLAPVGSRCRSMVSGRRSGFETKHPHRERWTLVVPAR